MHLKEKSELNFKKPGQVKCQFGGGGNADFYTSKCLHEMVRYSYNKHVRQKIPFDRMYYLLEYCMSKNSYQFYTVTYHMKWVKTSRIDGRSTGCLICISSSV